MGFTNSIEIASAGMSAQRRRLEVIASNLANSKTTRTAKGGPYVKKLVNFRTADLERADGSSFADSLRQELKSVEVNDIFEDSAPPLRMFEPTHPDANAEGYVLYPNINPVDEMVNMLGAARSYEANLEVLKTVKRLSNSALELAKV